MLAFLFAIIIVKQEGQHPLTGQQRAAKVWKCWLTSLNITQMINTLQLLTDVRVTCRIGINNAPVFNAGRFVCVQISRERSNPLPIYWYHSKGNWLRDNFAADSFYIMKLCSRLLVLYCRNCMKDDKFRYLIPILRKLRRHRTLVDDLLESPCTTSCSP